MSVRPVVHSHRQTLAFVSIAFQVVEESYRFRASPPWAVNEIEFQNATVLWRVSTCPRGRFDAVSQPVLRGVHLRVTADSANGSRVHRRPDLHFLPNQDEDEKPQHKSLIARRLTVQPPWQRCFENFKVRIWYIFNFIHVVFFLLIFRCVWL